MNTDPIIDMLQQYNKTSSTPQPSPPTTHLPIPRANWSHWMTLIIALFVAVIFTIVYVNR
jgi:hypothetical protein